jgi:uncharacterized cupredoxin-like copper-binding protein
MAGERSLLAVEKNKQLKIYFGIQAGNQNKEKNQQKSKTKKQFYDSKWKREQAKKLV